MSDRHKKAPGGEESDREEAPDERALEQAKRSAEGVLVPEILEAVRQEGQRVDVNVLLVQLVNKSQNPDEIIAKSEELLKVAQKFEDHRVTNFNRMADAIIDVKTRDPDEVEKRRNNRMRRVLKGIVGGSGGLSLGAAVVSAAMGGGIVLTGLFVTIGALALAMAGPLATGESISSNDVVRIVSVLKSRGQSTPEDEKSSTAKVPGRKQQRRKR